MIRAFAGLFWRGWWLPRAQPRKRAV